MTVEQARAAARRVLREAHVRAAPVPVELIARTRGITVQYLPMDDVLSGMAFVRSDQAYIVVNAGHHPNRQRFTLAHELAHHVLHSASLNDTVHVDKAILRRDSLAHAGSDPREIAANAFAAEILMPDDLIRAAIRDLDINDEQAVERLAREFRVSSAALNYRILSSTYKQRSATSVQRKLL